MKRIKKHRPLTDEEMAQLKIKPQWWLERQKSMANAENPRDTQFIGFAKLLMKDLDAVSTTTYASLDKAREAYELAIARRAYDLVGHTLDSVIDTYTPSIPDMTEWPDYYDE